MSFTLSVDNLFDDKYYEYYKGPRTDRHGHGVSIFVIWNLRIYYV